MSTVLSKAPNWYINKNDTQYFDIAVFFSSRNRPNFLRKCLSNLIKKMSNKFSVQIIVRLDSNDPNLCELLKITKDVYTIIGPQLDGYESMHIFYDECARLTTADILWQINDDAFIVSDNWDQIIIEHLKQFNNNIFTCCFDIRKPDGKTIYKWGFPIMNRTMYKIFGNKFCYGDVKYIDTLLRNIGEEMNTVSEIPLVITHQHIWKENPDNNAIEGCLAAYKWVKDHVEELEKLKTRLTNEMIILIEKHNEQQILS